MPREPGSAPNALLLDALGTLVELQPPAPRLREQLARRFGIEVTLGEAQRAFSAEIAYYRAHLDEARDDSSLDDLRRRCAEVLRAALPRSPGLSDLCSVTELLLAAIRFSAYGDAAPALRTARAHGWRLVVVSNWDVSLHGVLASLGLAALVDGIVTSAEIGARKPSAEIFERALTIAGTPAAGAIHVGDSVDEDVVGARAAGITPILLARGGAIAGGASSADAAVPTVPGVRVIRSLRELDLDATQLLIYGP